MIRSSGSNPLPTPCGRLRCVSKHLGNGLVSYWRREVVACLVSTSTLKQMGNSKHISSPLHSVLPKASYRPRWRIPCPMCRRAFCRSRWPSILPTTRSCARTSLAHRRRCTWTALLSTLVCRLSGHPVAVGLHYRCEIFMAMSGVDKISRYCRSWACSAAASHWPRVCYLELLWRSASHHHHGHGR